MELGDALDEDLLGDPLAELGDAFAEDSGDDAGGTSESSVGIADSDTGTIVAQETETAVVGLNIASSSSQTIFLDNGAGGAQFDVGGGGGAAITIVQSQ